MKISKMIIALSAIFAVSANAAYSVKIYPEANIVFSGQNQGNDNPPEIKRSLVKTLDFGPVSGETNLFTSNNLNGFVLNTYTFVLKDELQHGRNYYVSNSGNKECAYIADVCTMNKNCVYSKESFSGRYTILSINPTQAKECLTVRKEWFSGASYLSDVQIYDNPKTE
ncbi:hypothetical protein [Pseudomonas taiwanensis]|uniref:hypothetical protein n=1 Tax=Pseudomonas taiwanensis TaxID=470150 RepID=UPI001644BA23|nr:hypothetical protein [Pseudomonas taiwanensis]MBC3493076.1 hypothetical protein [Pseudomonas taiwanensis]